MNLKKFYSQVDETCSGCGAELPKGSEIWIRAEDEVFCPDCATRCMGGDYS